MFASEDSSSSLAIHTINSVNTWLLFMSGRTLRPPKAVHKPIFVTFQMSVTMSVAFRHFSWNELLYDVLEEDFRAIILKDKYGNELFFCKRSVSLNCYSSFVLIIQIVQMKFDWQLKKKREISRQNWCWFSSSLLFEVRTLIGVSKIQHLICN